MGKPKVVPQTEKTPQPVLQKSVSFREPVEQPGKPAATERYDVVAFDKAFSNAKKLRTVDPRNSGVEERNVSFTRVMDGFRYIIEMIGKDVDTDPRVAAQWRMAVAQILAMRKSPEGFWTAAQIALKVERTNFIVKMRIMRTVHDMKKVFS